jgi:hypothetical protein
MNIGSAFGCGWKCSSGVEHKKDEACFCCWYKWERACNNSECPSGCHSGYEVCPQDVFVFQSEGIKLVAIPYGVPEREIAELWYKYGCRNVRRDERYAEYRPKTEPNQNIEVQRLELRVGKLKEKLRKSSSGYLKKQEQLKKLNAFGEKHEAKGNKMLSGKNVKKMEEECVKRRVLEESLERKKIIAAKKEKKDGK